MLDRLITSIDNGNELDLQLNERKIGDVGELMRNDSTLHSLDRVVEKGVASWYSKKATV